jgi:hypothetical protein
VSIPQKLRYKKEKRKKIGREVLRRSWQGAKNGSALSEEEDQRLRAMYPSVDGLEALNAFPERTWFVLCRRGEKLGIRRSVADDIPTRSTYLLNV